MPEHPGTPVGTAPAPEGGAPAGTAPRSPADPVKALLHRHRELCRRAVDPLEIAAGLEAHGVTDRTAARFRHRDVFSLAEELYARAPRDGELGPALAASAPPADPEGRRSRRGRGGRVLTALLPGGVCALALAAHAHASGPPLLAVTAAGAAGLTAALVLAVRRGPLRARGHTPLAAHAATALLVLYATYGDGFLDQLLGGGPAGPWPPATAPLLALALAVVPAAACARLFAVRARRRLAGSRDLDDFTARARPLFLAVAALHLAALTGLLAAVRLVPGTRPGALAPAAALGMLLFLARLLAVHGLPHAGATALVTTAAAEVLACLTVLVGRLPGCAPVAAPVRRAVETWGTAAVPGVLCGAAALGLLAYAAAVLARASAHARP
ncbi:hypothetical protein [Streptomyces roseolilacinus]|uniref:Integral membrane protein n=1 Tax=Streptomyces roseolilacinus TaxID=66904 RepID=A0A918EJ63_9ACTN|nr:hypothetical protein [Streptomyces roseolilacinus]GGP88521.1 hypothetical protein GCM10010249_02640 [Streptomyces roseolilacinus]